MCKNDLNTVIRSEIIKICKILTKHNYFQYKDWQCIQEDILAIGAPTSSIFSEIYLQYFENTKIFDILVKHHIIGYFLYVDDILLVYKNNVTNIYEVLDIFNSLTPTMYFTTEEEVDNGITFLDITISKVDHKISFDIYRKLTATSFQNETLESSPTKFLLAPARTTR